MFSKKDSFQQDSFTESLTLALDEKIRSASKEELLVLLESVRIEKLKFGYLGNYTSLKLTVLKNTQPRSAVSYSHTSGIFFERRDKQRPTVDDSYRMAA